MTTPEVEIVMPYGVTVEGDGESKRGNFITESKYAPVGNLRLPAGPSNVHFSWGGPDEVHLRMYVPGMGIKTKGTIPRGGGALSHGSNRIGRQRFGLPRRNETSFEGRSRHSICLPAGLRNLAKAVV